MIHRELLELAAKAAGAKWTDYSDRTPDHWIIKHTDGVWREWRPKEDDGDAMRLAVACSIDTGQGIANSRWACAWNSSKTFRESCERGGVQDPFAANRLVILRAAAEIGKAMP